MADLEAKWGDVPVVCTRSGVVTLLDFVYPGESERDKADRESLMRVTSFAASPCPACQHRLSGPLLDKDPCRYRFLRGPLYCPREAGQPPTYTIDYAALARGYKLQARNMARKIAPLGPDQVDYVRVANDMVCVLCRLPYADHPDAPEGIPTVHILCNGQRVKL